MPMISPIDGLYVPLTMMSPALAYPASRRRKAPVCGQSRPAGPRPARRRRDRAGGYRACSGRRPRASPSERGRSRFPHARRAPRSGRGRRRRAARWSTDRGSVRSTCPPGAGAGHHDLGPGGEFAPLSLRRQVDGRLVLAHPHQATDAARRSVRPGNQGVQQPDSEDGGAGSQRGSDRHTGEVPRHQVQRGSLQPPRQHGTDDEAGDWVMGGPSRLVRGPSRQPGIRGSVPPAPRADWR